MIESPRFRTAVLPDGRGPVGPGRTASKKTRLQGSLYRMPTPWSETVSSNQVD